ncbi:hypothetical protein [Aeoliella sp.]|uniref:hypothetical protein n=1 Tax=Aeoliella sp. TaxID=2795800 RepID=UPI003CCBB57A
MDDAFPKPSKLLIAASVAAIMLSLLLGCFFGAMVLSQQNDAIAYHLPELVFWTAMSWGLAFEQYRSVFHSATKSAMRSAILLYLGGAMLSSIFVVLGASSPFTSWARLRVFCLALLGPVAIVIGRLNHMWHRELTDYHQAAGTSPRTRFSIRELLGLMVVLSVLLACIVGLSRLLER